MQDINLNLRARRAAFTALLAKRPPQILPSYIEEEIDTVEADQDLLIEYSPTAHSPLRTESRH